MQGKLSSFQSVAITSAITIWPEWFVPECNEEILSQEKVFF